MSPALQGIYLALAGFSFFSFGDVTLKILGPRYDTLTILFYMTLYNVAIYALFLPFHGGWTAIRRSPNIKWHVLRGLVCGGQVAALIYALSHMSMAKTYALVFCAPFILILLSRLFFKEPVSAGKLTLVIAGFGGVLVVLRPGIIPLDIAAIAGILVAFFHACSYLIAKKVGQTNDRAIVIALLPCATLLAALTPLYAANYEMPVLPDHGLLLICAAFSCGGFLSLSLAFIKGRALSIAPLHYIQILWGVTLGYLIFGDTLDLWTVLGAAIIIACGFWLLRLPTPPAHMPDNKSA